MSEDQSQYCEGLYRRIGKERQATQNYQQMKMKFKQGTMWKISKVWFVNQNRKYLGCSCKFIIDMNTSTFQPVLENIVKMPTQPTPPEDLATLLSCPLGQIVDVNALVTHVSQPVRKTTPYGERNLVDVTIMDDSGPMALRGASFPHGFPRC